MYLVFLLIFGLPILTMEFSVGRASQQSHRRAASTSWSLRDRKWHRYKWVGLAGQPTC